MTVNLRRSVVAWMFLAATLVAGTPAVAAGAADSEMSAAQKRANQAVGDLSRAEADLAQADVRLTQMTTRVGAVEARVGSLREQVGNLAVRRYVSGTAPLLRLLRLQDTNEAIRAQQFTSVIAGNSVDSLGRYRAERAELEEQVSELQKGQRTRSDAVENLRKRRAEAAGLVERLARQEQERQAQLAREEQQRAAAQRTASTQPQAVGAPAPGRGPAAAPREPVSAARAHAGGRHA